MDEMTQPSEPTLAPLCPKCRSPMVFERPVADLGHGQRYDVFKCTSCQRENLIPVMKED